MLRLVVVVLSLILILTGVVIVRLSLSVARSSSVSKEEFNLESEVEYQYFKQSAGGLLRDVTTFKGRKFQLDKMCDKYKDPFRIEHRALYKSYPPIHHFTYFNLNGSSHMMCSILKGGSNSWKIFMQRVDSRVQETGSSLTSGEFDSSEHKKPKNDSKTISQSCWPSCADSSIKIVQVRHPLERLLSAYRHVFEREKTYEDEFMTVVSLKQVLGKKFKKLSWTKFVDMIINNELSSHNELAYLRGAKTMTDSKKSTTFSAGKPDYDSVKEGFDLNDPDIWVSNHWSPYWYNCGLCLPELRPDFILHMDKLETDSVELLKELGMGHLNVSYPHTMKGHSGHSSRHNYNYFSQLSKKQVWQLWNIYRLDHMLFGFSPLAFLDMAQ